MSLLVHVCNVSVEIEVLQDELRNAQKRLSVADDEGQYIIKKHIGQIQRQIIRYCKQLSEKESIEKIV